jgi:cytochrome o ubiquinol oxidase operon protein cyoD
MSPDTHAGHDPHGHASADDHAHGSLIPFYLVMSGVIESKQLTSVIIMAFAAAQIVVHMIFFLHMNAKSESGWTLMALLFTIVIVGIALSGSLWIMYHLTANMMIGHDMGLAPR